MPTPHQVTAKIQQLPVPLLREVEDFVDFLLMRYLPSATVKDDLDAHTMTTIARTGGAFDWLFDEAEDGLYTDQDGEPV